MSKYSYGWRSFGPLKIENHDIYNQTSALKEAIDDLDWPGSSIQITVQPDPPSVTFRGDGHGDLQVDSSLHISCE